MCIMKIQVYVFLKSKSNGGARRMTPKKNKRTQKTKKKEIVMPLVVY